MGGFAAFAFFLSVKPQRRVRLSQTNRRGTPLGQPRGTNKRRAISHLRDLSQNFAKKTSTHIFHSQFSFFSSRGGGSAADKTSMFVPFRAEQNKRNKTEQKSAFLEVVLTTFVTFRHFPCLVRSQNRLREPLGQCRRTPSWLR